MTKLEEKLAIRLSLYATSFMSNSKWLKSFKALCESHDTVRKCLMKDVYDTILREVHIPAVEGFSSTFHDSGFTDGRNQPYKFKEIELLKFPSEWIIPREMRGQVLEPVRFSQNIGKIRDRLREIGKLETEFNNQELIIYGYK